MTPEQWQQIKQLYHAARECAPADRAALLAEAEPELRREVEAMLAQDASKGKILDSPVKDVVAHSSLTMVTVGSQLGPFQIEGAIASGGMGQVYRAVDTRLGRKVAIKISAKEFTDRFQREARAISALNHPHICTLYDVGPNYLVMELVDGETLAAKLQRGKLSINDTLLYGGQIAAALAEAHSKGITHRDLKPGNVMITKNGVKVLDFGLAKSVEDQTVTASNAVMGTPAYMAPEQLEGKGCDARTDIYTLGLVLREMATGQRGAPGQDTSMQGVPEKLAHVIGRCLAKDPEDRWQSARDVKAELEWSARADTEASRSAKARPPWRWAAATAVLVVAVAAVFLSVATRPEAPEIRVEVNTPATGAPTSFAISPDGRRLVFSASKEGRSQLWVRPLDSVAARPLAGTDGAIYPFWSPDGASVGFFADGKLKRVEIVGGAPQVLGNAVNGQGGTWNREGTIVFAPAAAGPVFKVTATGGDPVAVTRLQTGQGSHRFPQFLPDGRHFVYFVQGGLAQGVYAGSLDGGSSKRLANADAAAVVSPLGFLLFLRQTTLFAQAFDFKRQELSSNPFPVTPQAAFDVATFAPGFSAASNIVAYRAGSGGATTRQLTWLDRSGESLGVIGTPDVTGLSQVELSPDGKRVAVNRAVNGNQDVWLIDAARGVPTRFTFDGANDFRPVWSPDGGRVVFTSNRQGVYNLYWKLSSGAGADELLLESDQTKSPTDWSSDGRFLLFRNQDPQTGFDLWVLPLSGDKKAFPFLKTPFEEREGQFSPDGNWIAYQSNESLRFEIYVQPFPGPGGKFQISANGGAQPRWNKNGKEIFYVSLDSKMMAAPVKSSPDGRSLETGTPAALFPVRIAGGPVPGSNKQQYAVSSYGQRFLVNLAADEDAPSPITLIYNWTPKAGK